MLEQIKIYKVLWVDDDELILSTARRLLRSKNIELVTESDPTKAIAHLQQEQFAAIIADQRMPQMTGVDLLERVKKVYPLISRMMITGFLENQIIEEAINRGGVFRFITKPWVDEELITDIHQAFEHHRQLVEQYNLTLQVRDQNRQLTSLNENLEKIVFDRTKIISESKKEVEIKNSKIKNVISFIQELNRAEAFEELLLYFKKDFQSKFNIIAPYLLYESEKLQLSLMYFQKNNVIEKTVDKPSFLTLDLHAGKKEDQQFLAKAIGRPVAQIMCVPLLRFHSDGFVPILFLEHDLENNDKEMFLDFLTERLQVIGLAVDRSLMSRKLKYDSLRWEKTFDSIEDPIAIIDIDYNILRMNTAFDQFSKNLSADEKELIQKAAKLKTPQKIQTRKNEKLFELYTYPIMMSGVDHPTNFVNYYLDITEKRELYSKMIQNEKMVALGLMAGNIAHELNNPLTGVRSLAQVLIKEQNSNQRLVQDLEEVDKASLRCQKIIADLLDFSHSAKIIKDEESIFSVNDMINKTLPLIKTALRYHNLELKLSSEEPKIKMKSHQFQQILFNLIHNACQAMQEPGTLTVESSVENDWVYIFVEDTGVGIEKNILDKIFEPFFTTKPDGEGTGLGLSVCKTLLEKAKGKIEVVSEVSKGSRFKITLPRQQ